MSLGSGHRPLPASLMNREKEKATTTVERRNSRGEPSPFAGTCGKGLLDAIANGDVSKAQGMVLAGADVNGCRTLAGSSALHLAASQSSTGLCRLLISHSADVNAPDGQLQTVLHMAAQQGQSLLLLQLIEAHAVVDVLNLEGESPMSLAAGSGHLETMKHLLKASASPNAVVVEGIDGADFHPVAPLHRAVERNVSPNVIAQLIAMKACVDCVDRRQSQPLHAASHNGSVQIIRLLLEGLANPNGRNANMRTPLHYAAVSGAGRVIKMLVQHHADLEALDNSNMTPFQVAKDRLTEMQLRELGASGNGSVNKPATPTLGELRQAASLPRAALAPLSPLGRGGSSQSLPSSGSPLNKNRNGRRPGPGVAALIVGSSSSGAAGPKLGSPLGTRSTGPLSPKSEREWRMAGVGGMRPLP